MAADNVDPGEQARAIAEKLVPNAQDADPSLARGRRVGKRAAEAQQNPDPLAGVRTVAEGDEAAESDEISNEQINNVVNVIPGDLKDFQANGGNDASGITTEFTQLLAKFDTDPNSLMPDERKQLFDFATEIKAYYDTKNPAGVHSFGEAPQTQEPAAAALAATEPVSPSSAEAPTPTATEPSDAEAFRQATVQFNSLIEQLNARGITRDNNTVHRTENALRGYANTNNVEGVKSLVNQLQAELAKQPQAAEPSAAAATEPAAVPPEKEPSDPDDIGKLITETNVKIKSYELIVDDNFPGADDWEAAKATYDQAIADAQNQAERDAAAAALRSAAENVSQQYEQARRDFFTQDNELLTRAQAVRDVDKGNQQNMYEQFMKSLLSTQRLEGVLNRQDYNELRQIVEAAEKKQREARAGEPAAPDVDPGTERWNQMEQKYQELVGKANAANGRLSEIPVIQQYINERMDEYGRQYTTAAGARNEVDAQSAVNNFEQLLADIEETTKFYNRAETEFAKLFAETPDAEKANFQERWQETKKTGDPDAIIDFINTETIRLRSAPEADDARWDELQQRQSELVAEIRDKLSKLADTPVIRDQYQFLFSNETSAAIAAVNDHDMAALENALHELESAPDKIDQAIASVNNVITQYNEIAAATKGSEKRALEKRWKDKRKTGNLYDLQDFIDDEEHKLHESATAADAQTRAEKFAYALLPKADYDRLNEPAQNAFNDIVARYAAGELSEADVVREITALNKPESYKLEHSPAGAVETTSEAERADQIRNAESALVGLDAVNGALEPARVALQAELHAFSGDRSLLEEAREVLGKLNDTKLQAAAQKTRAAIDAFRAAAKPAEAVRAANNLEAALAQLATERSQLNEHRNKAEDLAQKMARETAAREPHPVTGPIDEIRKKINEKADIRNQSYRTFSDANNTYRDAMQTADSLKSLTKKSKLRNHADRLQEFNDNLYDAIRHAERLESQIASAATDAEREHKQREMLAVLEKMESNRERVIETEKNLKTLINEASNDEMKITIRDLPQHSRKKAEAALKDIWSGKNLNDKKLGELFQDPELRDFLGQQMRERQDVIRMARDMGMWDEKKSFDERVKGLINGMKTGGMLLFVLLMLTGGLGVATVAAPALGHLWLTGFKASMKG